MLSGSVVYYCIYLRSKQDEEATLTSGFYFEGKVVKECSVVGSEGGAFGWGRNATSIPRTEMAEVGRLLGEVNKLGTPAKTKK